MKRLAAIIGILFLSATAQAATTRYNPITGRIDIVGSGSSVAGTSGTIKTSTQFFVPYYDASGSSNSLNGFSGLTVSTTSGVAISTVTSSSGTIAHLNASTAVISGQGAGQIALREGERASIRNIGRNAFVMWADSSTHWGMFNPGGISTFGYVGVSTPITAGHCVKWAADSQFSLLDTGDSCAQQRYELEIATVTIGANVGMLVSTSVFTATATFAYVTSTIFDNVSTMTATGVYFDNTGSSMTINQIRLNGAGNGEIVLTKSSQDYMVSSSSVSATAGQCAVWTTSQTLTGQTCASIGGSGIVSPGTFTWVNLLGVQVSTALVSYLSNTTAGTSSSYPLRFQPNGGSDALTVGADGSYGYVQTWAGRSLKLNDQGNSTIIGTGGLTLSALSNTVLVVNGSGVVTSTTALRYAYKRPGLVWIDSNTYEMQGGNADGVTTKSCVLFPDGDFRCATETTSNTTHAYRRFVGGQAATWGTVSNAGLAPTEVLTATSTIAFYAIKSTTSATEFTMVGSTTAPVAANYSSLGTKFGTNSWLYLGMGQFGDNCQTEALAMPGFVPAYHAGALTSFGGLCGGSVGAYTGGIKMATGTGSAAYTYSSGMVGGGKIPPNVTLVMWVGNANDLTLAPGILRDPGTFGTARPDLAYITGMTGSAVVQASRMYPASKSMTFFGGGGNNNLHLVSWIDDALAGVGMNPAF